MKRFVVLALLALPLAASARDFDSSASEAAQVPKLRPEFKTPDEPNQLF